VLVSVRLFAGLRQRAGEDQIELELPDTASVGDALAELAWLTGGVDVVMAVNREYADASMPLSPGDELALIPPVSGGSAAGGVGGIDCTAMVRITVEPLSLESVTARVSDPRAGAVVAFLGVTRDVPALEYEAYVEMAERKLAAIVATAIERFGLCSAAAEHRVGTVPLSEPSVIVAASAPHRDAAFAGARYLIDEIKSQAPIWKREQGEWVAGATPPDRASE
jgi:molybdopterin synthase catalytic subunit